jgi:hypothetical protein
MTTTLTRTAPVAKTTKTTVSREQVETLLTDAAYIMQLTRRVRGDMVRSSVLQARDARQAQEIA